jgi:hypothetical protein
VMVVSKLALHLANNDLAENLFGVQPAPNLQTIRTSQFELLVCFRLYVALESQIIYFTVCVDKMNIESLLHMRSKLIKIPFIR